MPHGHAATAVVAEFPALATHHEGPLAPDAHHLHPAGLPWSLLQPALQGNGLGGWGRNRRPGLLSGDELNSGHQHQQQGVPERMADPDWRGAHGDRRRAFLKLIPSLRVGGRAGKI